MKVTAAFEKIKIVILICFICILRMVDITPADASASWGKEDVYSCLYRVSYNEQNTVRNPSYGSTNGEWLVMGLARYGAITQQFIDTYKSNLTKHLKSCNGVLSTKKYTEYSRVIIALTAIEENPENFAGYDLLKPLSEFENVASQGLTGVIYALIALDCGDYHIEEPKSSYTGKKTTRERLINYILSNQLSDGGWSIFGTKADVDVTAMAIQGLAAHQDESKIKKAIDKGFDCLGKLQQGDGCFSTFSAKSCETSAQVLTAMSVAGINLNDNRMVKDSKTVLDGMMNFYKDGGFEHIKGQGLNTMATEQAFYALTAYYRKLEGMNGLYNMKDGMTKIPISIPELSSKISRQEKKDKTERTKKENNSFSSNIKTGRDKNNTNKDIISKNNQSIQESPSKDNTKRGKQNKKVKKEKNKKDITEKNKKTAVTPKENVSDAVSYQNDGSEAKTNKGSSQNIWWGVLVISLLIIVGLGVGKYMGYRGKINE